MYVDAHAHLDKYGDAELPRVLDTIERERILTLSVSVDLPSFIRTEEIAARSDLVVPSFGIHPEEAHRYVDSLADLDEFTERSVMFGEIGLDRRVVTDESLYPAQHQVFEWFLERADDLGKLVNVHCVGAENETADVLGRYGGVRASIHWYSGPLDALARMIEMGHMFSVGVEVLQSEHIRRIAAAIPDDQLLTETDNPGGPRWLTGEDGYPEVVSDVVDTLAEVRSTARQDVLATVRTNTVRLFERQDDLRPWLARLDA